MPEHLPECDVRIGLSGICRICSLLRACEQRVLNKVIERAELTFRSDIINPVRDIIEPMLEGK